MIGKITNLIKDKPLICPKILFENYKNLNITEKELILLIYLINSDTSFNPKQISSDINIKLEETMELINSLMEKDIIKIDIINKKVREEVINLDNLYTKLGFIVVNGKEETKQNNIFDIFEKEFARTLSPMDYEIITDWQKEFDENLILLALKEAVFNGVTNLRYIDKIIRDWNKKGIKTEKDIINDRKKYQSKKENKKLFDYDWLNERDN